MKIAVKYKYGEKVGASKLDGLKALKEIRKGAIKGGTFKIEGDEITLIFNAEREIYEFIKKLGIRVYIVKTE